MPKITVPEIRGRKASLGKGERLAMVTAYDVTFARLVDQAGVDAILVGDSLGMVVQGNGSTLPVTLEEICYHGRAVIRGTQRAHVIGDMPFMTYQASVEQAVLNAGKLMKEGGFESIKLEGGREIAEAIYRIVRVGIPVVGHVGLMPQRMHAMGGFKVQGRSSDSAESILEDAMAVADAGAFCVVIEGVPSDVAARITRAIEVPTIGIGAGVDCDGQILVSYDLLGLNDTLKPKFVKRYEELFAKGVAATKAYVEEVRAGVFPGLEHSFSGKKAAGESQKTQPLQSGNSTTMHLQSGEQLDDATSAWLTEAQAYGPTQ